MAEGRYVVVGPRPDAKARRRAGYALVPVLAAVAAFFLVLPFRAPTRSVEMVRASGRFEFGRAEISVKAGSSLTFVNRSRVTHTATCDGCRADTKDVQPGLIRTVRFSSRGDFTVFCRYHRGSDRMEMTVHVK